MIVHNAFRRWFTMLLSAGVVAGTASAAAPLDELVGIKLGMTQEEVLTAIAQRQGIPRSRLDIHNPQGLRGIQENTVTISTPLKAGPLYPKLSYSDELRFYERGAEVIVFFHVVYPIDTVRPVVAHRVVYHMADVRENYGPMERTAIEKWGRPSYRDGAVVRWCSPPDGEDLCGSPYASLLRSDVSVHDPRIVRNAEAAEKEARRMQPRF